MAHKLRIKRGLITNLPSLEQGELALTTDTGSVRLWAGTASGNIQVGGPGLKPGSHSHVLSGTEITGTLPVAKGGTGITSNPSLLVNLASTTAASVFATSPRPGVTGTLAISHGGTGLTAAPSMLINLASTTATSIFTASPRPGVTGTLPIARGGTGATSAAAARTALGAMHLAGTGTTAPSASLGVDGDIYIQYV